MPQNPDDEPASVLLERIAEEREKLIRERKIKKPKTTSRIFRRDGHFYESINEGKPTCIDDDIPFDIPDSWEWVRLSSLGEIIGGGTPSTSIPAYWDGGIPWITPADMRNNRGKYISRGSKDISELGVAKSSTRILPAGSVVFSSRAPIGYVAITENELYTNQGFKSVSFFTEGHQDFIYHALIGLTESIKQRASGTTFAEISGSEFGKILIPLPPKRESSRIVKEIESYYSALEKIQDSRARYKRILSETPTSLRQQLIQAAIQGQLVPQNPNDEPASVLLEHIAQERTSKLGKKAAKSMSRIVRRGSKTYELFPDGSEKDISDEIPFEIPCSWEWARGKSIFDETKNRVPETDFSYIDIDAIDNKRHKIKSGKPTKKEEAPSRARRILESGDVLFSLVRPYLENIALVEKQYANAIASTGFYVVRSKVIIPEFAYSLFLSSYVIQGLNSFMKGDNSPSIRSENIEDFLYPVPPHAEQQRIARILDKILSYIAL